MVCTSLVAAGLYGHSKRMEWSTINVAFRGGAVRSGGECPEVFSSEDIRRMKTCLNHLDHSCFICGTMTQEGRIASDGWAEYHNYYSGQLPC